MMDDEDVKKSSNKKGVRRGGVRVIPRPFNPKLKFASKAEALEIRARENKANKAAEVARQNSLATEETQEEEVTHEAPTPQVVERKEISAQEKVQGIKKEIKDVRKALEKDPKSAKLKKKLVKLEADLDSAEDELEDLEETNNSNQE